MSLLDQLTKQNLGFLLDENVDVRIGKYLKNKGARTQTVPTGATDKEVAQICKEQELILLTNDTDFADIDLYNPQDFPAIIIFRIHPPRFTTQRDALAKAFSQLKLDDITQQALLIYEGGIDIIG